MVKESRYFYIFQVSKVGHESRIHVEDGDITVKLTDTFPVKVSID